MSPVRRAFRPLTLACAAAFATGACADAPLPTDPGGVPDAVAAKGGIPGKPGGDGGDGGGGDDGGGNGKGNGGGGFVDDFDGLDEAIWEKRDFPSFELHPGNVSVGGGDPDATGGYLRLATEPVSVDGGTVYRGGAVRTVDPLPSGAFEARIRASGATGSMTALFLYSDNDEIDIELIPYGEHPDRPGEIVSSVLFVTWENVPNPGEGDPYLQTHHEHQLLDFNPADGYHTYRIENKRNRVRFFIDGELRAQFVRDVPSSPMHLHLQARYPGWRFLADPDPAETGHAARVDRVAY